MVEDMLQLSDFQRVGWHPEILDDQIFLVRNVLTSDECSSLVAELESYTEPQWLEEYIEAKRYYLMKYQGKTLEEAGQTYLDEAWVDKNIQVQETDVTRRLSRQIDLLVEPYPELSARGIYSAQRQYEGVELPAHTDAEAEPDNTYAVIYYLNDDYEAGELYFPTRSLEVKPAAGSMIIFPTTSEYKHGVHSVGPGPTRYVLPSFIKIERGE